MLGYIFGGDTGETQESLKRKREIAESLLRRGSTSMPQNLSEGIVAVAQALSGRLGLNAVARAERANQDKSDSNWSAIASAFGRTGMVDTGTTGSTASPKGHSPAGREYFDGSGSSYFDAIKSAESGGNPNAKNPKSSATGLYQFTDATWNEVARAHPDLGLTPDGRRDPMQQEKAIRTFTADNSKILASAGLEPSNGNLYAAHFLGAGGARSVLSSPDDAPIGPIVGGAVMKANSFLNGMTVGDFKRWTVRKAGAGGDNTLAGGEGDDMLAPQVPPAAGLRGSRFNGSGLDTRTGGPASSPKGPMPAGREYFTGTELPQMPQAMATPQAGPAPQMRPQPPMPAPAPVQPAQQVDPMQTAAVPPQRPRVGASPRIDDAGYAYGVNAQPQNAVSSVAQSLMRRQGAGTSSPSNPQSAVSQIAQSLFNRQSGDANAGYFPAAPAAPGEDGPSMAQLLAAADDPYLSDDRRRMVDVMLQRRLQETDPRYQMGLEADRLGLEKGRLEIERLRNPVDEDVLSPEAEAQKVRLAQAGRAETNVTVGSEKGYDKTVGEGYGKRFLDIQDAGAKSLQAANNLDVMEQTLGDEGFYSGAGGEQIATLKRLGSALGFDPEGITSIETFNAMSKQAALDTMGGSLGTGFSNADRDFVVGQVPNLGNTPDGNRALIGIQRKLNQRRAEVAQLARTYAAGNEGRIDAGFDDYLASWAAENPLFPQAPAISAPQGAIDMLRSNPSLAPHFDEKYGSGAAARILGGQ